VLRKNFFSAEEVVAIATDFHNAGLTPEEVAIMDFAQKVTRAAPTVTAADVDLLRAHGLTDPEILDVVLTTAARNFFSKALDALGAEPDAVYGALEPALQAALTLGRPLAGA
jgi:alkylhydroperoxidase family enzyme